MELHDDLSQQAAALGIRLSVIKTKLANLDSVRDALTTVESGLVHLTASIHALSHELHPAILEGAGFSAALRAHCEEFEALNGIKAHLRIDTDGSLPSELALCLYRIAQEALRNAGRHSGAKEVWVSLAKVEANIHLSIEDRGRGFDPRTVTGNGIGLVSIKERVRMVGGAFEICARPGGGTVLRVVVPAPRHHFGASAP